MPCFDQNIKKIKRQIKTTTQNVRILCMQYHTCYKMFLYDHQFFTYIKQGWNFIKSKTVARWFPENFAKFLRMSFFTEHFQWLLLQRFGLSMKIQNETCHIGFVYCTSMALWQSYIYIYIHTKLLQNGVIYFLAGLYWSVMILTKSSALSVQDNCIWLPKFWFWSNLDIIFFGIGLQQF